MSHKDLTTDTVTYSSTLMKGLCHGGRVLDAQKLFKEIMHVFLIWPASRFDYLLNFASWLPSYHSHWRDVCCWEAWSCQGTVFQAFLWMECDPLYRHTMSWSRKGLLKEGLSDEAYELFRKMEDDGCVLDRINRVKLYIQNQGETVLFFCNFQVERNVC